MPPLLPQHLLYDLARLATWLVLIFVVFLPLEQLFALRRRDLFSKRFASDLGYYFINSLIPGLLLGVPLMLAAWAGQHAVPYRVQAMVAAWPLWQRIVVGFVVGEIGFYWGHRWAHQIPLLWRFHAIHHAPEHVYFLISSRAHPIDNAFIRLCGLIPACVLGVASPLAPSGGVVAALIVIIATAWGFFIHANIRWRFGFLEWLIATPGFHHWHHTRSGPRDRNFASMLPLMDVLFGTAHLPRHEWPSVYGTETALPASLVGQLLFPFARVTGRASSIAVPPASR